MSIKNYVSKKAEPQLLKEGDNVVSLLSYVETATNQDVKVGADGKLAVVGIKDKQYEWKDAIEQIALHMGNDTGSIVHRASQAGRRRYSDLTAEEIASGDFVEVKTFACKMINGQLERVEHAGHTATCERLIGSMLYAIANGVEGVDGQDILDGAVATKSQFIVTVKKEPWTDPDTKETNVQMVVTGFKPLSKGVSEQKKAMSSLEA